MEFTLNCKEIIQETFLLTGQVKDLSIINNLKEHIKINVNEDLSHKTYVKGKMSDFSYLINNQFFHDFLKHIQPYIYLIYKNNFIINSAWANICKKSEQVLLHNHLGITAFCGILYLTKNGPGTYFKDYDITVEEEIGKFVLFSPILYHSVKEVENDVERITVAFNMNETKFWDENKNNIIINPKK
jgi:hypothetical protein